MPRTPSAEEVQYLNALKQAMQLYIRKNLFDPELSQKIEAYNKVVSRYTLTEISYAICGSFGASKKPRLKQEWDQFRVHIERVLLGLGYYNIKIKLLHWFGY